MEIKMSTGAILVPSDDATAKQLLLHGGVEVNEEVTSISKTKTSRKSKANDVD